MSERSKNQDLIDDLAAWMQAPAEETVRANGRGSATRSSSLGDDEGPTDAQVIEACRRAANAPKFTALYDRGDTTGHAGDDSAADLALLGILRFYTQDAAQLERLVSGSALGGRAKWRGRADYRQRTVKAALAGGSSREVYDWGRQESISLGDPLGESSFSSSHSPLGGISDDENKKGPGEGPEARPEVVWFSELGDPKPRKYIIEDVAVKGYPVVAYGAGGVAKSFAVLAGGIAIASASGVEEWLGLRVLEHGHVLYLDFELDVDEQHRRVRDLCNGLDVLVPQRLAYLSGVGFSTEETFKRAYEFVEEYEAVAAIIDSVGIAMTGDMDRAKEVNAFFKHYVEPFRRQGVTPFLVDHEGKRQAGERHRDKSPIGSVYKTNNSRSVLQFILDEYDEAHSALDIQVRQHKTNFVPVKPFGVRITFEEQQVSIETRELPAEEMMDEDRLPVRERVLSALGMEPQTVPDLERLTGAASGTLYNNLSRLVDAGEVVEDGYRGRKKVYRLFSSSPPPPKGDESDENKLSGVADLFADPPNWLRKQVKMYREDPGRQILPLCNAVAAAIFGEPIRGPELRAEVEEALEHLEHLEQ